MNEGGDDALNLKYEKYSPFSVCDVLKLYFRSLPEPLLGFSLYSPLVSLMRLLLLFLFNEIIENNQKNYLQEMKR